MGQEVVSIALYIIISASPSLDFFFLNFSEWLGCHWMERKKTGMQAKHNMKKGVMGSKPNHM